MFKKTANALIADPIIGLNDWERMYGSRAFGTKRASSFKKIAADQSKYLLSHVTIMASVMVEPDPYDFLIKPECSHLVNNNDDGWTNEVLKLSHKSFIGGFNFVEHYQNSQASKGHILDSVLRRVDIAPNVWVYFDDLLVATDMFHEKLVADIRAEKVKYLSMGCVTELVICSFCGARISDSGTYCNHLSFQKGMFLQDEDGIPRRVAELCGHKSLPNGGVRFVEASWVAQPAFPGAAKRSVVAVGWMGPKTPYTAKAASGGIKKAASVKTYSTLDLNEALRDADLRRLMR